MGERGGREDGERKRRVGAKTENHKRENQGTWPNWQGYVRRGSWGKRIEAPGLESFRGGQGWEEEQLRSHTYRVCLV